MPPVRIRSGGAAPSAASCRAMAVGIWSRTKREWQEKGTPLRQLHLTTAYGGASPQGEALRGEALRGEDLRGEA